MKQNEFLQLLMYFGLLISLTPMLGKFMARVFEGRMKFLAVCGQGVVR